MKRFVFLFVWVGLTGLALAQEAPETAAEKKAIIQTALDYIEGWYAGDVARMDKALHPDLIKRYMQALPTGREVTTSISKTTMLEYTRAAFGPRSPNKEKPNTVEVLAVDRNIASVRCVSGDYYDYLHLVKTDEGCKIINVLWTPVNPPQPRQ